MIKVIDWNSTQEIAAAMETSTLIFARKDAVETAAIWDAVDPSIDTDQNAGFYHDQASVYARELQSRGIKMV